MNKKDITIILLIIVVIVLTIFSVFSTIGKGTFDESSKFLEDTQKLQDELSFYVGQMYSDTFEIYEKSEIITGKIKSTNEIIKDNKDSELIPIVDVETKLEKNGKISYKINKAGIEKVLNIKIKDYDDISWYIEEGSILKVKFENKPKWWSSQLDYLLV